MHKVIFFIFVIFLFSTSLWGEETDNKYRFKFKGVALFSGFLVENEGSSEELETELEGFALKYGLSSGGIVDFDCNLVFSHGERRGELDDLLSFNFSLYGKVNIPISQIIKPYILVGVTATTTSIYSDLSDRERETIIDEVVTPSFGAGIEVKLKNLILRFEYLQLYENDDDQSLSAKMYGTQASLLFKF